MSFKFNESSTTTLERPTETKPQVTEIIDNRITQNSVVQQETATEIEKEINRFDNSHKAENLNEVYNEIDKQAIQKESRPILVNPFSGTNSALQEMHTKSSYKDVVENQDSATLELKTYKDKIEKPKSKKLTSRMKLWIATSACCAFLLVGLIVCNIFSIGTIEKGITSTENTLARQEVELENINGKISNESNTIPDGMNTAGAGASVDITPVVDTEITTSDNFFNRLSKIISYMFGR